MKALTLTQPWETLVAIGAKRIETRSWSTSYRGPIAIHAAMRPGALGSFKAMRDLCGTQPFFDSLMVTVPGYNTYCDRDAIFEQLPLGAVVAVANIYDVRAAPGYLAAGWEYQDGSVWRLTDQERAFGDYAPGRYAWLLADIRALPEPIPAKGAQGLWEWMPPDGWQR